MDDELIKAQRMVSRAIAAVQAKAGPKVLDEVNHQLKKTIKERQEVKQKPSSTPAALSAGDTVEVKSPSGQVFTVERLADDDVWLQGDILKMRVKMHEIEKRSFAAKGPRQRDVKVALTTETNFDTILDVRVSEFTMLLPRLEKWSIIVWPLALALSISGMDTAPVR